MAFKNSKTFKREFKKQFYFNRFKLLVSTIFGIILILIFILGKVVGFFDNFILIILAFYFLILPIFYVYIKSVDESSFIFKIKTKSLTEGDLLYKDVKVSGRTIKANLFGLSSYDKNLLKKNKNSVLIRRGVPFAPVFLLTFLFFCYFVYIGFI